jgi:hypothetical protein
MEYEFTLKYKLSDKESDADALVERLAEAGCDDALVGTGQKGRIALNFIREAASAKEAIISALTDVKRAIPHARLLEVTPDFVGLSDVAVARRQSAEHAQADGDAPAQLSGAPARG